MRLLPVSVAIIARIQGARRIVYEATERRPQECLPPRRLFSPGAGGRPVRRPRLPRLERVARAGALARGASPAGSACATAGCMREGVLAEFSCAVALFRSGTVEIKFYSATPPTRFAHSSGAASDEGNGERPGTSSIAARHRIAGRTRWVSQLTVAGRCRWDSPAGSDGDSSRCWRPTRSRPAPSWARRASARYSDGSFRAARSSSRCGVAARSGSAQTWVPASLKQAQTCSICVFALSRSA